VRRELQKMGRLVPERDFVIGRVNSR
jgi:hypothetical protein